jgi:hypothetical protein
MKMTALSLIFAASLALSSAAAFGADAKDYQVTGPVLEVNDKMIAVQKGKDRWELMKDTSTKMSGGDVKVGDKVTVHYTMTATSVEAKAAKAEKGSKKEEGAKTEASPKK